MRKYMVYRTEEEGNLTLPKAIQFINQGLAEDAEFMLEAGVHCVPQGVSITANNHFVRFIGAANGQSTISGGIRLNKWECCGGNLYRASAPGVEYVRSLYVDGKIRNRPKSKEIINPAWDTNTDGDFRFYNLVETFHSYQGALDVYEGYITNRREMLNYKNKDSIEFVYDVGWSHSICPVEDIYENQDGIIIKMKQPCFRDCQIKAGMHIGAPSYIENVFEWLQNPGEWYFDKREQMVYYLLQEGEDIDKVQIVLPVAEQILQICGSAEAPIRNISFKNITFSYSTWVRASKEGHAEVQANLAKGTDDQGFHSSYRRTQAGVELSFCEDILFQNCRFENMGCTAIDLAVGCRKATIDHCELTNIAGTGIQVGGFTLEEAHPVDLGTVTKDAEISNCKIHQVGMEFKGGVAILVGYADGVKILHNEVFDISYSGISVGWGWGYWDEYADDMIGDKPLAHYPRFHEPTVSRDIHVEYNHVYHVMRKLHDGAGIYTIGMNRDSTIIGNVIHDNGNYEPTLRHPGFFRKIPYQQEEYAAQYIRQKGFPGGIYLDQASGGFEVRDNIVFRVICPIFYHDYGMHDVFGTNHFENNYMHIEPDNPDFPWEIAYKSGYRSDEE